MLTVLFVKCTIEKLFYLFGVFGVFFILLNCGKIYGLILLNILTPVFHFVLGHVLFGFTTHTSLQKSNNFMEWITCIHKCKFSNQKLETKQYEDLKILN